VKPLPLLFQFVCSIVGITTVHATELTLEQCLARAAKQNSSLKAFEMATEAAESNKSSNRAAFFPALKVKARYTLTDQPEKFVVQKDALTPGLPVQDVNIGDEHRDSYQVGLFLTQPLFTGGSLRYAYERSGYQLRAAESEMKYQSALLDERVKKTFYELLASTVRVTSLTRNVQARKKLCQIVQEQLAEGYATRQEILAAEAAVAEAEAQLIDAQNQAEIHQAKLQQLMNVPADEPLKPLGHLSKLRIDLSLGELERLGSSERHDIQTLSFQLQQREAETGIARSAFFPNISLQGGYLRQRETNMTQANVWSVALQAEWNLFDWGKTNADVQKTIALRRQQAFHLEELKKQAVTEIATLWHQARTDLSLLLSGEARVKLAEHTLEQSLARYQEGKLRRVDLFMSEVALWQAYGDYQEKAAALHGVMASLERATAKSMDRWVVRSPLYQPDFADITDRLAAATPGGSGKDSTDERVKSLTATIRKTESQSAKTALPVYRLQFGAFSNRENAEKLLKALNSLSAQEELKPVIVLTSGTFRVMSERYDSKVRALNVVQKLGITTYLLKKENPL
jgi:outer membrane protein TolC